MWQNEPAGQKFPLTEVKKRTSGALKGLQVQWAADTVTVYLKIDQELQDLIQQLLDLEATPTMAQEEILRQNLLNCIKQHYRELIRESKGRKVSERRLQSSLQSSASPQPPPELSKEDALIRINQAASSKIVVLSEHAKERMLERNYVFGDIVYALRAASYLTREPSGNWGVLSVTPEQDPVRVICRVNNDGVQVVSVMESEGLAHQGI